MANGNGNGTIAIKNGYVFDPLNEIDGEIMDVFIKNGKVVRELTDSEMKDAKVIDATGMTVMPGGVDSHSHIAGAKVNGGRMMRPEDSYKVSIPQRSDLNPSPPPPNPCVFAAQTPQSEAIVSASLPPISGKS